MHTHFSMRNPSTLSHGNYPISLFFSFKWNNILNCTRAPNSISTKLSQSLHHKPFLFLTGLCIIASIGSLQRSPTAETTLPFQVLWTISHVSRRDCFHLFRLPGWILLSTTQSNFPELVYQNEHGTYVHSEFFSLIEISDQRNISQSQLVYLSIHTNVSRGTTPVKMERSSFLMKELMAQEPVLIVELRIPLTLANPCLRNTSKIKYQRCESDTAKHTYSLHNKLYFYIYCLSYS